MTCPHIKRVIGQIKAERAADLKAEAVSPPGDRRSGGGKEGLDRRGECHPVGGVCEKADFLKYEDSAGRVADFHF